MVTRRLVAVLAADVAGYTRLVERDTDGTVSAWRAARDDVIDPTVARHAGRVVKLTGDGFLAEFPTAQGAVECAVDLQRGLAASALDFRIGVSLGDIVDDGDDIHGEGVNIAARIEALAEPGGVWISGDVYAQVRNRVAQRFEDGGEHRIKNVSEPVRVYRLVIGDVVEAQPVASLTLPDKPSIAVLPFENRSNDPEQDYFSDGIAEDIITDLSKIGGLFVIARNSSFRFRGPVPNLRQVARELGVHYLLEGSVRKAAARVRINAQLVDALGGNQLWAERYDGDLADVFALQDCITESIVATLSVTLSRAEEERALGKAMRDLRAYDYVLRGNAHHHRMMRESVAAAKAMYEAALALDPEYAPAHAGLAWVLVHEANQGWTADAESSLSAALRHAQRAVALDDSLAKAHMVLGDVYLWTRQNESAVAEGRRAVALEPSYADGHFALSVYLRFAGRPEEAIGEAQKALRFNPAHAHRLYFQSLSACYDMLGRYDEAAAAGEQAVSRDPEHFQPHLVLAAACARAGRVEDARRCAREVVRLNPDFSSRRLVERLPFKDVSRAEDLLAGLRAAGLPE